MIKSCIKGLRKSAWGAVFAIAACGNAPLATIKDLPADLPRFAVQQPQIGVSRSNEQIARDFLDLTFRLENGEQITRLLKFEGPVRIALNSPSIAAYMPELDDLITRLRREAGINISLTDTPQNAQLFVEAIPRRTIQRVFPGAACFIIPGVKNWDDFRSLSRQLDLRWSAQRSLGPTAIFIPSDSTPQDTRDCLHEEIAQALGPANDLFRIPDTIFNDDNFHSVLTPFDMTILRALYAPQLTNGMTRSDVAARLPGVLAEVNPSGNAAFSLPPSPETRRWKTTIEAAMDRSKSGSRRRAAADQAIQIASFMEPIDHRLGLALLTLGRIEARRSPQESQRNFNLAFAQFNTQFGPGNIRSAHVAIHLALLALERGDLDQVLALTQTHRPAALRAQNAVVLSGLLAIEAEALRTMGDLDTALDRRAQSLSWARYAFGDADGVIAKAQAQIAAYSPTEDGQ